jgi:hypothetical protein
LSIEGGWWQHLKGGRYSVIGLAKHSETLEPMVMYHPDEKPQEIWVRPLWMWHEGVKSGVKRFTKLEITGDG